MELKKAVKMGLKRLVIFCQREGTKKLFFSDTKYHKWNITFHYTCIVQI